MMKITEQERQAAIKYLKGFLKPGRTVHTILRHCSRSGMMRHISVIYNMRDITRTVANALDGKRDMRDGGIKQGGCGMDMGLNLIYNLGRVLYPKGFKLAKNQYGRNGDKTGYDKDGGYALNQKWL